jgi:hypothetical protein
MKVRSDRGCWPVLTALVDQSRDQRLEVTGVGWVEVTVHQRRRRRVVRRLIQARAGLAASVFSDPPVIVQRRWLASPATQTSSHRRL